MSLVISDRGACSIPDPDREEVIITGGAYTRTTVSVYSEAGWQRDLAQLTQGRRHHACSSFTHDGENVMSFVITTTQKLHFTIFQHLIVTGGWDVSNTNLDTTEVFSFSDNAWTKAGKLPAGMAEMRAATINNRVLLFGNYSIYS